MGEWWPGCELGRSQIRGIAPEIANPGPLGVSFYRTIRRGRLYYYLRLLIGETDFQPRRTFYVPTLTIEPSEMQRLAQVLELIARRIELLKRQRGKKSEELINYRKYMWEDAALFDRAERVQSENVALTQERAVTDVSLRLKHLGMLSSSPYFGRIDFQEDGTGRPAQVYIGLHGLYDDNHDMAVYDWRAPVSGMFYDYEVGPADYEAPDGVIRGDISLKRQYKIENGRMLYMFDSSLAIGDEILRDALARNTTEKMRQIVNSIQKEQNAVIRSEGRKVLIVQGPAGSGKTSIAMHRAAYLLYRHRGHISANNLLIFSPNEVFADYISNVLPELGEDNIREATFDDCARSILGKKITFETKSAQMEFILSGPCDSNYALRTASIELKSSPVFLRIVHNYVRHLKRNNLRFTDIRLNDVVVVEGSTVEALYREHCAHLAIMPGIERLKDRVLSRATYSSSVAERRIEREVEKVLVDRDPVRLYRKLFKDPALVTKLAEGEPLPDNLHSICKLTYKSMHGDRLNYEDVAPALLLKRLIDGEPRYANVRHLIIDEGQDYSPVQFEVIRLLFGDSSMTILGDLSQQINAHSGLGGYEALKSIFGRDTQGVIELSRSYRSTREISEFAAEVLADPIAVNSVRDGGRKPVVVRTDGWEQTWQMISEELTRLKEKGMGSVGVICKTRDEAFRAYSHLRTLHDIHLIESESIAFHHGLVVLPVYLAKGLEFDAVIIHDAGADIYSADSERKLLYTAFTRALHELTVYYSRKPSPLLPVGRWELFDGVEC